MYFIIIGSVVYRTVLFPFSKCKLLLHDIMIVSRGEHLLRTLSKKHTKPISILFCSFSNYFLKDIFFLLLRENLSLPFKNTKLPWQQLHIIENTDHTAPCPSSLSSTLPFLCTSIIKTS